jgi:hypothetical protein
VYNTLVGGRDAEEEEDRVVEALAQETEDLDSRSLLFFLILSASCRLNFYCCKTK